MTSILTVKPKKTTKQIESITTKYQRHIVTIFRHRV